MPAIVIVDRSSVFSKPDYCIHGETFCYNCEKACWLGDKTYQVVVDGAYPLCMECASEMGDRGLLSGEPESRVRDHRRADGPH